MAKAKRKPPTRVNVRASLAPTNKRWTLTITSGRKLTLGALLKGIKATVENLVA